MESAQTTNRKSRWWNTSIDWFAFLLVIALLIFTGDADPGDVVFVFVFENIIMIVAFIPFYLIFYSWHNLYLQKHQPEKNSGRVYKGISGALELSVLAAIALIFIFGGYLLVVFLLDQISVELMVAFFQGNNYHFETIDLLAQSGMFFEPSVISGMKEILNINYGLIFLILGLRYFGELVYDLFANSNYKNNKSATLNGAWSIATHAIVGPVSILIAMILLVVLTSSVGNQAWIPFAVLIFFRLIFNWMSNKIIRPITSEKEVVENKTV